MEGQKRNQLRKQAMSLPVTAQIGKGGLSEGVVEEIRRQVLDKRLLKVRLLAASADESRQLGEELAAAVGAEVVELRGHTLVLWKAKS